MRLAFSIALAGALCSWSSAAIASPTYSDVVLADNPVGYWRLSDPGATPAVNDGTAGAAINGTYSNFPPGVRDVPGLIVNNPDTAAEFTGNGGGQAFITGSGLNAGGNPFAGSWTIEGWFRRDSVQQWSAIFSNNNGATLAPLMTFRDNTNELGINGAGVTADGVFLNLGTNAEVNGSLVYAAITKTGSNAANGWTATVYAWVDGVELTPVSGTANFALNPADAFYIGRHWTNDTQQLDGVIDEVAIYNYALTAGQVEAHYLAGVAVPEPSTALLAVLGVAGMFVAGRRKAS